MAQLMASYTDNQLIELYQKTNNVDFFGELYKRHATLTYGLCYKYLEHEEDAKDAVVEIFELLIEKLKTSDIQFFKSWLYIVAKNYLIKIKNKNNLLKTTELDETTENNLYSFMENEPEMTLNIKEKKSERLQQAISNLNEEQHTCIELFYYQQKSYQEVASITGYDLNKVKSAIQNGKRNLKLFMVENNKKNGQ